MDRFLRRSDIADIAEKVQAGERLNLQDGVRLYATRDVLLLGKLADYVNQQRNQNRVHFVQNIHINPTNVCIARCNFCSFWRNGDEDDAYLWTIPEIMSRVQQQNISEQTRELHIVSGLHPDLGMDYYCDLIRALKQAFPWVHIKAFTAVEIDYMARMGGTDWEGVLRQLRDAGLNAMTGGGAEIFHPRVRRKICPGKIVANGWLAIHGIAHRLGMKSNATMLYGHIEQDEDRVDHLMRLRDQQDKSGGFLAFVPLAYHPHNNNLGRHIKRLEATTGFQDLRNLAISRLMLDNFPHIKGYWVMITPRLAQISLSFGVSDIDGTIAEERITHDAGARTERAITRSQLVHMIRDAGKIPVERDALYHDVEVYA